MPTYDYLCARCGERFERFELMSARPEQPCPSCGGTARRQIGGGGGILVRGGDRGSDDRSRCDRSQPCCGREVRCDAPPCGER